MSVCLPLTESFPPPRISYEEIFRYASCPRPTEEIKALCREAVEELEPTLSFRVVSLSLSCSVSGNEVDLGVGKVTSSSLAQNLAPCREAVLFAATVGTGVDRAVFRYEHLRPAKALMMSAVGTQRVEALCDAFCENLALKEEKKGRLLRPRFSPGYGDLPLSFQKKIFNLLLPEKIGITLNEHSFMIPTKSVTALVGIYPKQEII
jgi:hypothetical protein